MGNLVEKDNEGILVQKTVAHTNMLEVFRSKCLLRKYYICIGQTKFVYPTLLESFVWNTINRWSLSMSEEVIKIPWTPRVKKESGWVQPTMKDAVVGFNQPCKHGLYWLGSTTHERCCVSVVGLNQAWRMKWLDSTKHEGWSGWVQPTMK